MDIELHQMLLRHRDPICRNLFNTTQVANGLRFHSNSSQFLVSETPRWSWSKRRIGSLALESDGTLWEWGSNDHGQLGNGTTNDAYSPTLVLWPLDSAPVAEPINLAVSKGPGEGSLQIAFTNTPGGSFTVLGATNFSSSLTNWAALGNAMEVSPGSFQFTDPRLSDNPQRFYRVTSP
jgi:hypothetical protein